MFCRLRHYTMENVLWFAWLALSVRFESYFFQQNPFGYFRNILSVLHFCFFEECTNRVKCIWFLKYKWLHAFRVCFFSTRIEKSCLFSSSTFLSTIFISEKRTKKQLNVTQRPKMWSDNEKMNYNCVKRHNQPKTRTWNARAL